MTDICTRELNAEGRRLGVFGWDRSDDEPLTNEEWAAVARASQAEAMKDDA